MEGEGLSSSSKAAYLIVVDNHTLDLLSGLDNKGEILDAVIRDLRDVEKTRHAVDLNESTVGLEELDHTSDNIATGHALHLGVDKSTAVRDHQLAVFLVELGVGRRGSE